MLKLIIISLDLIVPVIIYIIFISIFCLNVLSGVLTETPISSLPCATRSTSHVGIVTFISLRYTWHVTVTSALDNLQYLIRRESHVINNSSSRLLVHPCVRGSMSGGFSCNDCLHMATCSCALVTFSLHASFVGGDVAALGQHQYCMILLWTTSFVGLQSLNHMNGITWMGLGLPVGSTSGREVVMSPTFARECVWPQNLQSLPFPNTMIYCSVTSCKTMNCQKMSHDSTITVYTDVNDGPSSDWGYHHDMSSDITVEHEVAQQDEYVCVIGYNQNMSNSNSIVSASSCVMTIVSASSCVMAISILRETAPWLISTGIGSLPVTMSFPFSTFLWATRSATISLINCFLLFLTVSNTFCGGKLATCHWTPCDLECDDGSCWGSPVRFHLSAMTPPISLHKVSMCIFDHVTILMYFSFFMMYLYICSLFTRIPLYIYNLMYMSSIYTEIKCFWTWTCACRPATSGAQLYQDHDHHEYQMAVPISLPVNE